MIIYHFHQGFTPEALRIEDYASHKLMAREVWINISPIDQYEHQVAGGEEHDLPLDVEGNQEFLDRLEAAGSAENDIVLFEVLANDSREEYPRTWMAHMMLTSNNWSPLFTTSRLLTYMTPMFVDVCKNVGIYCTYCHMGVGSYTALTTACFSSRASKYPSIAREFEFYLMRPCSIP